MNTPIKLVNPLSDKPTEMWMQAIGDFETVLTTPGYEIDMNYWYTERSRARACLVCMAGASMVRRSQGLARQVYPDDYPEQDRRKLQSINSMREGHFKQALYFLSLPEKEEVKWIEVIKAADLEGLRSSLCSVYIEKDWSKLIKLLREAIGKIEAEYAKITAE